MTNSDQRYELYLRDSLFPHQKKYIEDFDDRKRHYIAFEMRVGKTKTFVAYIIKTMIENPDVTTCFICAPKINHQDIEREFKYFSCFVYLSSGKQKLATALIALKKRMRTVLITSYEFWNTRKAMPLINFAAKTPCIHIFDECDVLGTPTNMVYKNIEKSINKDSYVRLVSGTGLSTNVKNIYSQVRLIDNDLWLSKGIRSKLAFEKRYIKMLPPDHPLVMKIKAKNKKLAMSSFTIPAVDEVTKRIILINSEELSDITNSISHTISRTDIEEEGGKQYFDIKFELTRGQKKLYADVQKDRIVDENTLENLNPIQKEVMYKKIISGISPITKSSEGVKKATKKDRVFLEKLLELHKSGERILAFFTFIAEVDFYKRILTQKGIKVYVIQGTVPPAQRDAIVLKYQKEEGTIVLATISAAGIGTTFSKGNNILFYSNLYSLRARKQAEDRCSALAKKDVINIYDFTCSRIDSKIRSAHLNGIAVMSSLLQKFDSESDYNDE